MPYDAQTAAVASFTNGVKRFTNRFAHLQRDVTNWRWNEENGKLSALITEDTVRLVC